MQIHCALSNTKKWWVPIVLMGMLIPLTPILDLETTRFFFQKTESGGHFTSNPLIDFIYQYGVIPGQVTGCLAILVLVLSYCSSYWKKWRSPALLLVLTIAIGAGFITHTVLKDHWGRPRPRQVIEFGGMQPFRPLYEPNFFHQPEPSKSFPCGHCTMGFCFFALALIGKRRNSKMVFFVGVFLSIVLGVALSATRIAQGGHFLSDVLMSALIMWLTTLTCDWLINSAETKDTTLKTLSNRA